MAIIRKVLRFCGMRFSGIIILCGIAYFIYYELRQTSDVEKICSQYVVGTAPPEIAEIKRNYFADVHGPIPNVVKDVVVSEGYTFCSVATMCDISCSVEISDGKVISSEYFGAPYREEQIEKNMGAKF